MNAQPMLECWGDADLTPVASRQAMGDLIRERLAEGPASVPELMAATGATESGVRKALHKLQAVAVRRPATGTPTTYALAAPDPFDHSDLDVERARRLHLAQAPADSAGRPPRRCRCEGGPTLFATPTIEDPRCATCGREP